MKAAASLLENVASTPASYLRASRRVRAGEVPGLRPLRVAFLSTVSAQMLEPFLVVEAARWGLHLTLWFAPFGQLEEQALEANSPLYQFSPEAIVILARIEELAPAFCEHPPRESSEARSPLDPAIDRLGELMNHLREHTKAALFVANFAPPEVLGAGLGDALFPASQTVAVQQANARLARVCSADLGAFLFDYARTVTLHGLRGWHDARLLAMARQPWSVAAQIALSRALTRTVHAAFTPPAKCLILDADDTLWGGILGEEGLGGIALGEEYPGNIFKGFQKYLRCLRERGILLALVSKNEEADVVAVLEQHADCILRPADFAARRINWQDKSANLREIAAELNLGLEALVFFDDNPFEREEVRRTLPAVQVLDVPADPLQYIATLEESAVFDQLRYSAEDWQRAGLYQQQQARTEASRKASSPEEFRASLGMVATIGQVSADTLPRVAQLLAKTNQFNLTTRRHTAAQIADMITQGAVALWLRLADDFGDHGLVGVAIARPGDEAWTIDTFLLSCRVIGRGVETALLSQLAACVLARGGAELIGEYVPSARNALVAGFYPRHGFAPCGGKRWNKKLSDATPAPAYIRVQFHE